jgi:HEAT repeat protein
LWLAVVGVALLNFSACSQPGPFVKVQRLFIGKQWTDTVEGVVPPAQKIDEIRRLGRQLKASSGPEQEILQQQLLALYQAEQDPNIRWEIFRSFGVERSPQNLALVELALNDPEVDLRIAACMRLGQWGGSDSAERLAQVLTAEKSPAVRFAAVRALGQTRCPQAIAALAAVLEERDPAFQLAAMESLKQLTGKNFGWNAEKWRDYVRSAWAGSPDHAVAGQASPPIR